MAKGRVLSALEKPPETAAPLSTATSMKSCRFFLVLLLVWLPIVVKGLLCRKIFPRLARGESLMAVWVSGN